MHTEESANLTLGSDLSPSLSSTLPPAGFNEAHQLHLRVSCEYIDRMLQRIETVLHSEQTGSPFSRYRMDISPAQGRVLEDYVRRLRLQLLATLAWQRIQIPSPEIPATRSIATDLHFIQIALSELRPYSMRGCGELSPAAAVELSGIVSELSTINQQMMRYVKNELQESLRQRIQKLSGDGQASILLERIEQVVTEHGLVEFRPRMDLLLARLENATFEVAVFGRVCSGKSSLLNALLGMDALPVGSNPITSVPTRIQHGPVLAASVRFGSGQLTSVGLDRFRELISEDGNPGNREGVRQAVLEMPSSRLAQGVVLVDTPGLGSLAIQGSREALAYLPSCDLALLLIDAGATLTLEDIGTLRLIHEASIPCLVLLSKADLLDEPARRAAVAYIAGKIEEQLHISIPVHPVSSRDNFTQMLDAFYEDDLQPRFQHSHTLRLESVRNKILRLQDDVLAALRAKVERIQAMELGSARSPRSEAWLEPAAQETIDSLLLHAASRLATLSRILEERILHLGFIAPDLVEQLVPQLQEQLRNNPAPSFPELTAKLESLVHREVSAIVELLQTSVGQAVAEVQQAGRELRSGSLPEEQEILSLIRDAPRFEIPPLLATQPASLGPGYTRYLGTSAVRRHLLRNLRLHLQPTLHQALGGYAAELGVWVKHILREIQFSIDSFADVYRTSLQEMAQPSSRTENTTELRSAIAMLGD